MIGRRLFCLPMFDYNSRRWKKLCAAVLREAVAKDGAPICQYLKRYGRRVEATHVHHIWPAEGFPEYAYCEWNLAALTQANHDKMHDRITRKLTPLGERWRRRTIPPGSTGES